MRTAGVSLPGSRRVGCRRRIHKGLLVWGVEPRYLGSRIPVTGWMTCGATHDTYAATECLSPERPTLTGSTRPECSILSTTLRRGQPGFGSRLHTHDRRVHFWAELAMQRRR